MTPCSLSGDSSSYLPPTAILPNQYFIINLDNARQMSDDNNQAGGNPFLINSYAKSTSRLNKNWITSTPKTTYPPSTVPPNSEVLAPSAQQRKTYDKLMPRNVSELSPSVIFQDADGPNSLSQKHEQEGEVEIIDDPPKPVQKGALGIIGNAFMGATTRYQKTSTEYNVSTPNKNIEEHHTSNKSQTNSQTSATKFGRRREAKPAETKPEAMNINIESLPSSVTPKTDRSNAESRRIERKSERGGKLLKFMEKKDTEGSDLHSEHGQSRITEPGESKLTKETVSQLTEPGEKTQIQPAPARGHRPIQRNNPGLTPGRSRISSQRTEAVAATITTAMTTETPEQQIIQPAPKRSSNKPIEIEKQEKIVAEPDTSAPLKVVPAQRKPYLSRSKPIPPEEKSEQQGQGDTATLNQSGVKSRVVSSRQPSKSFKSEVAQTVNLQKLGSQQQSRGPEEEKQANSPVKPAQTSVSPNQSQVSEKVVLSRSNAIPFVILRMLAHRRTSTFNTLRQYTQQVQKHQRMEGNILGLSCLVIAKQKEANLLKMGFDQLRKKFIAASVQEAKNTAGKSLANPANTASLVLSWFFQHSLREGFNRLKSKFILSQKGKPLGVLGQFLKSRESSLCLAAFLEITARGKVRWFLLNQFSSIFSSFLKGLKQNSFNQLRTFKIQATPTQEQPTKEPIHRTPKGSFVSRSKPALAKEETQTEPPPANTPLLEKQEKLRAVSQSITDNLAILENDLAKAKQDNSTVEQEFNAKVSVQRQHNTELQRWLGEKRAFNDQLSKDLLSLPNKVVDSKAMEYELEPTNSRLEFLTNIYINHYRNPQESLNLQDLVNEFSIDIQDSIGLVTEWNLFLAGQQLKREIDSYEGTQMAESKARKIVGEEQELALRLVRSYVREQYFWQWLHASVENL